MELNGVINLYKEEGFTSHDAVAVLRGILKVKKIGHTGTLDPQATGVLPICVGKATKVSQLIMGSDKEYVAELCFGSETDTQDATGRAVKTFSYAYDAQQVENAVASFAGEYEQIPPMYSALKVGGMKLYELAREGIEVERKPRKVHIKEIELLEQSAAGAKIRVRCSKGTYIRTLCEDIGKRLGYGAHMRSLERTQTGPYHVKESYRIDEIRSMMQHGQAAAFLQDLNSLFADLAVKRVISEEDILLLNGNYLTYPASEVGAELNQIFRMQTSDGKLAGLYKVTELLGDQTRLRAYKMFV